MRIKLGVPLKASLLCMKLGIRTNPDYNERLITHITTRSSLCERGDLFIALRGESFNGCDFLPEAKERGALTLSEVSENTDFSVKSSHDALLSIANLYISKLASLREVIAVTGSVGKTTTRELIYHLIKDTYRTHATEGNLNNTVGVPLTVIAAPADTEILLIEAGMNSLGELRRISAAINPTLSVITNIGNAHIGRLGCVDMVARAKLEILSGMKRVRLIAPDDCKYLTEIQGIIPVSVGDTDAPYRLSVKGKRYNFFKNGREILRCELHLIGEHIPYCLSLALATADTIGVTPDKIKSAYDTPFTPSRMKISKISGITLLDDAYNAAEESVRSALKTLGGIEAKRRIALLGDMLELGSYTRELHMECGALAARVCDMLITFGVYSEFYAEGACDGGMSREKITKFNDYLDINKCADFVTNTLRQGDALLIKASHKTGLYQLSETIKERLKV